MFKASGVIKVIAQIWEKRVPTNGISFDFMARHFAEGDCFAPHSDQIDVDSSKIYASFLNPLTAAIPADKFNFAFVSWH